jgi:hypothetical protein
MNESMPPSDDGEKSRKCATPQAGLVGAALVLIVGLIAAAVALRCWLF